MRKILIANRGEIASRIIRTCKELGILTVAIYSEADKEAPFVSQADEAYLLGAPRVEESYMDMDKVFEIANQSGAEAIHPGYGFFSENAAFAKRCKEEGITFIGPSPEVIAKMGNKIEARLLMKQAGMPVVPGTDQAVESAEEAVEAAEKIGYPVMLKAAAGGGGIGMVSAANREECVKAFASNSERAKRFFGDGSMFVEKKIENARHIEVQIIADDNGNVIHLFDRECSIQRRNQKVIEEAVSPFLSEQTRNEICMSAVNAAKSIGYVNAGTFEFIADEQENFYFLEMNTRIQVEHPVTEEVTGIDIVQEQLNVARGKAILIDQSEVKRIGHAIEARIYAEDPHTFFPSPGKITTLIVPEMENLRNEVAVVEDYTVTPFYDPMIAKVIARGENREEACDALIAGLEKWQIEGIKTNKQMVLDILKSAEFKDGNTTTDFVAKYYLPNSKK
ncbi:acetyl-CoA carboxylase biotin carboxylase subunit [Aciduricibacillus chroicocephali]|uniref:Acetyl-CoA carboxylase biotin carboxylase subunit n=1 Tax=Aciduricibacillus chroicocephali TaxID=3054939 RepID=A0ABY9KZ27_9BACI|nr:acetyl-CoA carboxylase biotin carboxylase subunit [Bacillaceae bacterium 44XB]